MSEAPKPDAARSATRSEAASWLIVVGRVLLLLLAVGAVAVAFLVSRQHDHLASTQGGQYVCPMHPEVRAAAPSECPICHMALVLASTQKPAASSEADDASDAPLDAGEDLQAFSIVDSEHPDRRYQIVDVVKRRTFTQEVKAPAWVSDNGAISALLYKDELAGLTPNERGSFLPARDLSMTREVRLGAEPPAPHDRSTVEVAFHADRASAALAPGTTGWVKLPARSRVVMMVPYPAVLQGASGPYVLIAAADGHTFSKRPIEIGKVFYGMAIVLAGVRVQEHVVIRNAFFVDAERRLQAQSEPMPGAMP